MTGLPTSSLQHDSSARCLDCDYPLCDLSDARCPECGRPFDLSNGNTINATGRPFPAWARLLIRPIGWPMHLLTLVPILVTVWELRRPGGEFYGAISGLLIWLLVAPAWLARLVARTATWWRYDRPLSTLRGHWSRWTITPALFLMWIVLTDADWPQRIAFRVSRPALERIAQRALDNPTLASSPLPVRAGPLQISRIEFIPEGVRLYTGPGYDAVPCGYAYCPRGYPPEGESNHYYPWWGAWWQYWANDPRTIAVPVAPTTAAVPAGG